MKYPEFHIFSGISARINFLIFPSTCPNCHGFLNLGGGVVATTGNKQCEHNLSTACEHICNNNCSHADL